MSFKNAMVASVLFLGACRATKPCPLISERTERTAELLSLARWACFDYSLNNGANPEPLHDQNIDSPEVPTYPKLVTNSRLRLDGEFPIRILGNGAVVEFRDPFNDRSPFYYIRAAGSLDVLIGSIGPDGKRSLEFDDVTTSGSVLLVQDMSKLYDPTNGAVSPGDIFVSGQNRAFWRQPVFIYEPPD